MLEYGSLKRFSQRCLCRFERRARLQPAHQTQPPDSRAARVRALAGNLRLPRDRNGDVLRRADLRRAGETFR